MGASGCMRGKGGMGREWGSFSKPNPVPTRLPSMMSLDGQTDTQTQKGKHQRREKHGKGTVIDGGGRKMHAQMKTKKLFE